MVAASNNAGADEHIRVAALRELMDGPTVVAMLERENELRLSTRVQELYAAAERRSDTDWMEVTLELQKQVATEFGYGPDHDRHDDVLVVLRRAAAIYPELPETAAIPLYVKHNRAGEGRVVAGEAIVDVPLLPLADGEIGCRTSLTALLAGAGERPLVVIAGSYS
ncbi:uncharacterized protein AMSG_02677 [Thecamonas trahens ATCC 50062]|uniref:Uncharacterized protein n=1 Tax=Thecamonas trahens ATCC 50062 TaxID=461836 RepID=A0A0L0D1Z7_THETB|nr:hypothetical protein AMSG_02677 [Thecamonas trahens ATCC 50062]KNC46226.1 hypothetical protein AMSG_02677 [Thecamonas trahens ATCC 50062]|eukprot:XP_013760523.1 hypothetical protein AMSG_02677 [Thecamonas trahens ATCC 50062]